VSGAAHFFAVGFGRLPLETGRLARRHDDAASRQQSDESLTDKPLEVARCPAE
jgi:hypothetical protein